MIKVLAVALILTQAALFVQVSFTSKSQRQTRTYKAKCDSLQHVVDSLHTSKIKKID